MLKGVAQTGWLTDFSALQMHNFSQSYINIFKQMHFLFICNRMTKSISINWGSTSIFNLVSARLHIISTRGVQGLSFM